ncbi:MAG: DUF4097 family beta strand repeat-containing protein [Acutalibacteraceae bacterium]|nr:DUF4097 family beta strand repeat protein [Clostridia bacterium]MEE3449445.1 DUF4097 family beta strand repeat-containing protein [Acutalibacteraceae bacterium]
MKLKGICLSVYAVIFLSLIMLTNGLCTMLEGSAYEASAKLAQYDPTDMSLYYAMGEYYPPDTIDALNIDWKGGRVEIIAYDGDSYFVEEGATRQLRENERLSHSLSGNEFSIFFTESEETVIDDAYKKVEIRVPVVIANNLKKININTNGEVVLKNIFADEISITSKTGNIICENVYSPKGTFTNGSGDINIKVASGVSYRLDYNSVKGKLNTYLDAKKSYVVGNGEYTYKTKTNQGNVNVSVIN